MLPAFSQDSLSALAVSDVIESCKAATYSTVHAGSLKRSLCLSPPCQNAAASTTPPGDGSTSFPSVTSLKQKWRKNLRAHTGSAVRQISPWVSLILTAFKRTAVTPGKGRAYAAAPAATCRSLHTVLLNTLRPLTSSRHEPLRRSLRRGDLAASGSASLVNKAQCSSTDVKI